MKKIKINKEQKELIIGTLLGDANLQTQTEGRTWRYRALHSEKQYEYILHKYNILKNLCNNEPKLNIIFDNRTLKNYKSYYFNTLIKPGLRFYANLFYKYDKINKKFIKVIPKNIIKYLTPKVLTYWYMDDGSLTWLGKSNAMRICTENYDKISLIRIKKALLKKYNLNLILNKQKKGYRLLINEDNSLIFRNLIEPNLIPSMKFKVSDGNKWHL